MSERWARRRAEQLDIEPNKMINANVHMEAEEGCTDLIWNGIARHILAETSYETALDGARECAVIDRAFRGVITMEMRGSGK